MPPYFIARAARDDESDEEYEEGKIKQFLRTALQKYAFITICLCASVPNPLFDLAGLMAGHFGIPFIEFFLATALGKAVIKVQMQVIFTSLLFSGDFLHIFFGKIDKIFPILNNFFTNMLENQKQSLFISNTNKNSSIIGILWNLFIFVMIMFFVASLLNTIVKREYVIK